MKYDVRIASCAEIDIAAACNWYESKIKGLGHQYLESLDNTLLKIADNPKAYPKLYKDFRRALLRKFPYSVFYLVENKRVLVIAVYHEKRNREALSRRTI